MKKWYESKTLWVNAIALIGIAIQTATGKVIISEELQVLILAGVNFILRIITKDAIDWGNDGNA